MGEPLKNAPVYFTVAQVRFNPVLKLKDYLADIQEGLRRLGYPDFRPETLLTLQFGPQGAAGPVQHVTAERFVFGNAAKTHCFVLATDALSLLSTRYGTFEDFSKAFLDGLLVVHKTVGLDFIERVGLRYLDRVVAKPGEQLSAYLTEEVRGLASKLAVASASSYAETRAELNGVQLVARTVIQSGPLGFPADMEPMGLTVEARFLEHDGLHAILDSDGFVQRREAFSAANVMAHLKSIHDVIDKAFRATATKHAFEVWGAKKP